MAFAPAKCLTLNLRRQCVCAQTCSSFRGVRLHRCDSSRVQFARFVANISSNDFRPGTTIQLDGVVYRVNEFLHVKPGKGAAFVRTKLRNMKTGNTMEKTFKAGEMVKDAILEKVQMQHTYVDGNDYVFMNMDSYEEERMSADTLGNDLKFLLIGMDVEVLKHNQDILGVELPKTVSYTVTKADPGAKGNTAQGSSLKPCTIESGAEVMVPLFIKQGKYLAFILESRRRPASCPFRANVSISIRRPALAVVAMRDA